MTQLINNETKISRSISASTHEFFFARGIILGISLSIAALFILLSVYVSVYAQGGAPMFGGYSGTQTLPGVSCGALEPGEPNMCSLISCGYWFSYQAPTASEYNVQDPGGTMRRLQIDSNGSNFDTTLAVYKKTANNGNWNDYTLVASDDNGGSDGTDSILSFEVTPGTLYSIQLGKKGGSGVLPVVHYQHITSTLAPSTVFNCANSCTDGALLWDSGFTNPTEYSDIPMSLVEYSSFVYVGGIQNFTLLGTVSDARLEKRNKSDGSLVWAKIIEDSANVISRGIHGIDVDSTGIYLGGSLGDHTTNPGYRYVEKRSHADGSLIWSQSAIIGKPHLFGGFLYVVGGPGGNYHTGITVEKRNLDSGSLLWRVVAGSPGTSDMIFSTSKLHSSGIYASTVTSTGGYMQKRNLTDGSLAWSASFDPGFPYVSWVDDSAVVVSIRYANSTGRQQKRSLSDGSLLWEGPLTSDQEAYSIFGSNSSYDYVGRKDGTYYRSNKTTNVLSSPIFQTVNSGVLRFYEYESQRLYLSLRDLLSFSQDWRIAPRSICPAIHSPPTNFTATPGLCNTHSVNLTWDKMTNATSYTLKRYVSSPPTVAEMTAVVSQPVSGTPVIFPDDTVAPNGGAYYYGVTATYPTGTSTEILTPFLFSLGACVPFDYILEGPGNIFIDKDVNSVNESVTSRTTSGSPPLGSSFFDVKLSKAATPGTYISGIGLTIPQGNYNPINGGVNVPFTITGLGSQAVGTYIATIYQSVGVDFSSGLVRSTPFNIIINDASSSTGQCGATAEGDYGQGVSFPRGSFCEVDNSNPSPSLGLPAGSTASWSCVGTSSTDTCNAARTASVLLSCNGVKPSGSGVKFSTAAETEIDWNYIDPPNGSCQWACQPGYSHLGSEKKCRPIPGWEEF